MVLTNIGLTIKNTIPKIIKRNYGMSYVLCSHSSDPVQQLFIEKIREFGAKIK